MKQVTLHFRKTHNDKVYGDIFEGWISGDNGHEIFGGLASTHCAMNDHQAWNYRNEVIARGYARNVEVVTVFDE